MATIADELNAISVEHGYTGAAPKTIAGAIDALADTLAGTDVEGKRTIAGAVKALAPYIGSGGGGSLGELVSIEVSTNPSAFKVSTAPYDISGDTYANVVNSIRSTTNVCLTDGTDTITAPNGCYIAISSSVPSDWSTDSLGVYIGEETVTSGFECRKLTDGANHWTAFFTMQIPETVEGYVVGIDFGIE